MGFHVRLDLLRQTVVRWLDPDPKFVPLLCEGGVTAVLTASSDERFAKACADAGIAAAVEADVPTVGLEEAGHASGPAIFTTGLWPGVQRPDPQVASATRSLWLDQNCSLVQYIRALHPKVTPVLGYRPDQAAGVSADRLLPFETLELALAEAWVSGGNYVMALHPRFREELLKRGREASAAWGSIGRTAKWLRANDALFRRAALPIVTVLVDESEAALEVAHLTVRQNVSPALAAAADPPPPDPARRRVLVAVSIGPPQGDARQRILAHAEAGTTLIVEGHMKDPWWRVPRLKKLRSDSERDYYSLGKGQVVVYRDEVVDPGMLALDVFDIIGQKERPARIWNCNAGIVMASTSMLTVLNYSRPVDFPVIARIQGSFRSATLLRPEADPEELKVAPRGSSSEVSIPRLARVAAVVFR
jgi:hypothetical protein